jgi:chemotaxis protein CheZ
MGEIAALRALIAPQSPVSRESMERARAQIAEAQAYKHELDLIYAAVKRTREAAHAPGTDGPQRPSTDRAGRELEAIVADTERATQSILQAAEAIERGAVTLSAALKNEHEQGLAHDIRDRVMQVFEACNFQDLTGQRAANVIATLRHVEVHVARLMAIWQGIEQFKPVVFDQANDGDRRFLNGPKLAGDRGHSSQDDIDAIFGCA